MCFFLSLSLCFHFRISSSKLTGEMGAWERGQVDNSRCTKIISHTARYHSDKENPAEARPRGGGTFAFSSGAVVIKPFWCRFYKTNSHPTRSDTSHAHTLPLPATHPRETKTRARPETLYANRLIPSCQNLEATQVSFKRSRVNKLPCGHMAERFMSPPKEPALATHSPGASPGSFAAWKKPDPNDSVLCDSTCVESRKPTPAHSGPAARRRVTDRRFPRDCLSSGQEHAREGLVLESENKKYAPPAQKVVPLCRDRSLGGASVTFQMTG